MTCFHCLLYVHVCHQVSILKLKAYKLHSRKPGLHKISLRLVPKYSLVTNVGTATKEVSCVASLDGLFIGLVAFGLVKIVSRQQSSSAMARPYQLLPIKLGCEVIGIKLSGDVAGDVITMIKEDVTKHRILVFKN